MLSIKEKIQQLSLYIFILSLLSILLLLFFYSGNTFEARNGELDFSPNSDFNKRINKLNGQWKVIFDQFVPPDTDPGEIIDFELQTVPGTWNKLHNPKGYASYLLKVKVPHTDKKLMLIMPTVSTSYSLFINGQLASESGIVGKSNIESKPENLYQLVELDEHKGNINIVIHVSNYQYSKGGLWNSPSIGIASKVEFQFYTLIFTSILITGGLGLVGLSLMVLFIIKRKFKAYKNLGLFCLLMALRTLLVGEVPLTQFYPMFPWPLLIRVEYLTMSLGFIAFNSYFYNLYKRYYKLWIFRVFIILSGVFSILIVLTPVFVFTSILIPIQILMISGILYSYLLFYLSRKEMKEANSILLFGFTIIQLMVILDILIADNVIHFNLFQFNTSVGVLIFIFCNAIILMRLAVKTTANLEQLTQGLEKSVKMRTRKLEQVNRELFDRSITDKLTGINNRHEYTRVIKYENARFKRTGNHYASLYLDLDNFKYINDNFGHAAGDKVLVMFTSILKKCSRDSDYLFRMGGDEFYLLMTEISSSQDALKLAERVHSELEKAEYFINELKDYTKKLIQFPKGKEFSVTIGISSTDIKNTDSLEDLLIQSDLALIEAKASGKNKTAFL